LASLPLTLSEGLHECLHHPLLDLISKPNPMQDGYAFFESIATWLLLSGNAYIECVLNAEGMPIELYVLNPERMRIIPGPHGFPSAYQYTVGSHSKSLPIDPLTGFSNILHLKFFHPNNDLYGLSPLQVAMQSIHLHNTISEQNVAFLKRAARPSGALMFKGEHRLNATQKEELMRQLQAFYEGTQNAGRSLLLEGQFEWMPIGPTKLDFDFQQGAKSAIAAIAQSFGVPTIFLTAEGTEIYNKNYEQVRYHFIEDTDLPLYDRILKAMNGWIVPRFQMSSGERLMLSYNPDKIDALAPRLNHRWEQTLKAGQCLTVNEQRARLGYGPLTEGDQMAKPHHFS